MFHYRESELAKLNRRYQNRQFECIVIYGRRRVGKTALINEFCKDKKTIFFAALNATERENLTALSKAIYECEKKDACDAPVFSSFDSALDAITDMAEERLVFVIDEFPYLAKAAESISSRLQHMIDHKWQHTKLYLILCGSSMSFMEEQVLGYESPLYGRRTAQFKIEPLSYREVEAFYPGLSKLGQAVVYGITGGIPLYINKLGVQDGIKEALLENLFDASSYLFEEPQNLLKQELREPAVYNTIITTIASGASKLNEIATKAGLENAVCSKYTKVLLELGIIKKETPMTEKPGKKTIYRLADHFFGFWYRYVPHNMGAIVSERMGSIFDQVVAGSLSDYMGTVFEDMCKCYMLRYAQNLHVPITDIGQWWGTDPSLHKEVQIDIVAGTTDKGTYYIGSCKYKKEPIGVDELKLLEHYAGVFGKGKTYIYYIFSKGGFTQNLEELEKKGAVHLISLEMLYE